MYVQENSGKICSLHSSLCRQYSPDWKRYRSIDYNKDLVSKIIGYERPEGGKLYSWYQVTTRPEE